MLTETAATLSRRSATPTHISLRFMRLAFLLLPCVTTGCMAFNVPSVRYDDPTDRGGLLGPQRTLAPEEVDQVRNGASLSGCHGCAADEELVVDEEAPPEVPWPRFHPLPTRPVFSAPAG
jgi:hypothetical protein